MPTDERSTPLMRAANSKAAVVPSIASTGRGKRRTRVSSAPAVVPFLCDSPWQAKVDDFGWLDALRQSESRLHMLVETMSEGFVVMDGSGTIVFVNDRFAKMLDDAPAALRGVAFVGLVHPAQRQVIADYLEASHDALVCEPLLLHADGRALRTRVSLRRMATTDVGGTTCAVVSNIDEDKKIENALRKSEADLRCLSNQILTAQETERRRIANDLHDGLGQSLSAIKFGLEYALCTLGTDGGIEARRTLESLMPKVKETVEEVRCIAMNLRPSTLDDFGIIVTLTWFVREFQAIYRGLAVDVFIPITEGDVPDSLKVTIFRIVQEAMNNIAKHSHASRASVRIEKTNDILELTVADDGVGFDPVRVDARQGCDRGHGLAGMMERTNFSGGTAAIDTAIGRGVRITMSWPRFPTPAAQ